MKKKTFKGNTFVILLVVLAGALVVFFFLPRMAADPNVSVKLRVSPTPSPTPTEITQLSWPKDRNINPKVLMYHHIGPLPADADDIRKGLTVSVENFESQLKYLSDNKYNVVTLKSLYEMVAREDDVSRVAVLTFDDGYDDNFTHALPVLKKYGFKGTFFIISDKIGESEYMNETQVRELVSSGNEIGSHSVSHPDLADLSKSKVAIELQRSKEDLETLTGRKIVSLCYPAGKFSIDVENEARSSGYKIAVTTEKGAPFSTNNPFEVPRYRINPATSLASILR